jgi:hypothetical protein
MLMQAMVMADSHPHSNTCADAVKAETAPILLSMAGLEGFEVLASFADDAQALASCERIEEKWEAQVVASHPSGDLATRESRFMGRIVLVIVGCSIVGTAVGAAFGAVLAVTIGPPGVEGLIIQIVAWAIFAHLLIGMWAGYILLADRTGRDLKPVRAPPAVVRVECATIDESEMLAARLRSLGALTVEVRARSVGYQI